MITKKIAKSRKGDADASASLSSLPDEIILEILNKLIDLKTLCVCYLVSRRFSSIVVQVDAISFSPPLINPSILDKKTAGNVAPRKPLSLFIGESFLYASTLWMKFKGVKSFCLELPSSSEIGIDNRCFFKWMVTFGTRIESFIFLSPNSISDKDGFNLNRNGDEEETEEEIGDMFTQNFHIAVKCVKDVMVWRVMLLNLVIRLPMLEKVSITDSERRGRLSLSREKIREIKEWLLSASETELRQVMGGVGFPDVVSRCYIPVLKLPISKYVMKGVYVGIMKMKDIQGGNEDLMNSEDGFEDKEEAAYNEAMMEILEKHKGKMQIIN